MLCQCKEFAARYLGTVSPYHVSPYLVSPGSKFRFLVCVILPDNRHLLQYWVLQRQEVKPLTGTMRWSFFLYIAVLLVAVTNVFANDGDDNGDFFVDENAQDEIRYDLENETFSPNIQEEINNIGEFTSVR